MTTFAPLVFITHILYPWDCGSNFIPDLPTIHKLFLFLKCLHLCLTHSGVHTEMLLLCVHTPLKEIRLDTQVWMTLWLSASIHAPKPHNTQTPFLSLLFDVETLCTFPVNLRDFWGGSNPARLRRDSLALSPAVKSSLDRNIEAKCESSLALEKESEGEAGKPTWFKPVKQLENHSSKGIRNQFLEWASMRLRN